MCLNIHVHITFVQLCCLYINIYNMHTYNLPSRFVTDFLFSYIYPRSTTLKKSFQFQQLPENRHTCKSLKDARKVNMQRMWPEFTQVINNLQPQVNNTSPLNYHHPCTSLKRLISIVSRYYCWNDNYFVYHNLCSLVYINLLEFICKTSNYG